MGGNLKNLPVLALYVKLLAAVFKNQINATVSALTCIGYLGATHPDTSLIHFTTARQDTYVLLA